MCGCSWRWLLLACLVAFACRAPSATAHPLCLDFTPPLTEFDQTNVTLAFCTAVNSNPDGSCCDLEEDAARKKAYALDLKAAKAPVSAACQKLHRLVTCGPCEPWAAHLYADLLPSLGPVDGMKLCNKFCKEYFTACETDLALPANFCALRSNTPDPYYCYPFEEATFTVTDPSKAAKPAYPNLAGKFPRMMSGMLMRPDRPAWWIVDQLGWIWELEDRFDAEEITPIMTFQPKVQVGGEMGLIGLAFHPNFANNRRFYLNYINYAQETVIAQFTWTPGDLDSTSGSETLMLTFPQPETNHNGGWMGFSPYDYAHPLAEQHYMFIGTGDGGGANDQHGAIGNGQDLTQIYGKMLRLKIPADDALRAPGRMYSIPEDNPFATSMGQWGQPLPEIYAWGLRNSWRCSFDSLTGELWCADVGESRVEEINIIELGGNYGWRLYEGTRCNADIVGNLCDLEYTPPVWEYCHEDFSLAPLKNETRDSNRICNGHAMMGQSITGGFVYRGKRYAKELAGQYLFADFETSVLGRLKYDKKLKKWDGFVVADGTRGITRISTFAEHFFTKELYMVSYVPNDIYRLYVGDLNATTATAAAATTAKPTALPAQEAAAASTTLGSVKPSA